MRTSPPDLNPIETSSDATPAEPTFDELPEWLRREIAEHRETRVERDDEYARGRRRAILAQGGAAAFTAMILTAFDFPFGLLAIGLAAVAAAALEAREADEFSRTVAFCVAVLGGRLGLPLLLGVDVELGIAPALGLCILSPFFGHILTLAMRRSF
ncbi:MAG: hypothetical protein R3F20_14775 [Planctomycetota bacterium]